MSANTSTPLQQSAEPVRQSFFDPNDARLIAATQGLRQLFEWATKVRPEDIPQSARQRAASILFDDISAIVGAWDEPEFQTLYPRLVANAVGSEASILPQPGIRADTRTAALTNAVAANWLELDEGYRKTPCHAGLYVLPALLAVAEADDVRTDQLLHTLVVAYEVITRIARAYPQRVTVMQSHGRYAALGAACAVALHRKYNAELLAHVASAAVTLITPSPRNHLAGGALARNIWAGVGARNGIDVADWAPAGITGMDSSIHDVFVTVLGGDCKPDALTEGLGSSWAVMDGYTKMYACCQHLHAAVEAALDVREQVLEKGISRLTDIHVETHDLALPLIEAHPGTSLSAKFSMAHAMASAVVLGSANEQAFSSALLKDQSIDQLRQRVAMSPWPGAIPSPPNDRPARVHFRFEDGTAIVGECLSARGGADRPFPQEALLEKIERLAGKRYPGLPTIAADLMSSQPTRLNLCWREVLAACATPATARP